MAKVPPHRTSAFPSPVTILLAHSVPLSPDPPAQLPISFPQNHPPPSTVTTTSNHSTPLTTTTTTTEPPDTSTNPIPPQFNSAGATPFRPYLTVPDPALLDAAPFVANPTTVYPNAAQPPTLPRRSRHPIRNHCHRYSGGGLRFDHPTSPCELLPVKPRPPLLPRPSPAIPLRHSRIRRAPRFQRRRTTFSGMESIVKRYQSKYRKVREDMVRWHELQSQLLSQFGNAASITERLPVLLDAKKYGALRVVSGTRETLITNQIESWEGILSSMKETLKEFHAIVKSFKKIWQDCHHQVNSCSKSQLQQRIGIHPSLAMCSEGFQKIYEMHLSEYLLKESLISSIAWNTSSSDLNAMHQFLTDQPNIPKDEVQWIFDTVLAEEID